MAAHAREDARRAAEPGIELDYNTRNIRDPELRKTFKRTTYVGYVRGPGTDGVRVVVPMGDLVPPLTLYERAEAATTMQELAILRAEEEVFEKWAGKEFEQRAKSMALQARINPEDSERANAGIPKEWIPARGGVIGFGSGQATYLAPGVERYPPLEVPHFPIGRKSAPGLGAGRGSGLHGAGVSAGHSSSHASHHSAAHSRASGTSTGGRRDGGGRDPYSSRSNASGF